MKLRKTQKALLLAAICTCSLGWSESSATISETIAPLETTYVLQDEVNYVNETPLNTVDSFKVAGLETGIHGNSAEDYKTIETALAVVETKDGYGLIDAQGHEIVKPAYKYVEAANKGRTLVFSNPKNKKKQSDAAADGEKPYVGVRVVAPERSEKTYPSDLYFPYKDTTTKRYGFKNVQDEVVIAPKYKDVYADFSEDRAFVKNEKGKLVGIDGTGQELFQVTADIVYPYNNGLAEIQRHTSGFNLLGAIGNVALGFGLGGNSGDTFIGFGHFYDDDYFDNHYLSGVMITKDKTKRGYIDRDGRIVVDSKNDYVYPMMNFGTIIEDNNQLAVVNRNGQFLIPFGDYELESLSLPDSYIALKNKNTEKRGVMNYMTNTEVLPFLYSAVDFMNDSYVVATADDGKHVYRMEPSRQEMFKLSKDAKYTFFGSEGVAWVTGDSLLGDGFTGYKIIDKTGQVLYEAKDIKIQDVSNFKSYYTAVRVDNKWGVMDTHGHWVVEPTYKNLRFIVPTGNTTVTVR
ncbi:MAG: WG repeat-containing protein [Veillonella sp.]|uniref:WG repeat-containing protein n=1 Tax=Veillonella sp. TaxID=1926307 RepID=UPI0025DC657C|nr:WG repeat-containing protein [Veillonella sp.]MBS4914335.1 WG repeat-containing protein [Veillonella sp.]